MTIETKELVVSEELKRKVEIICRFAYVDTLPQMEILKVLKIQIRLCKISYY